MAIKLTDILGIEYPIIQGGMAWVSEAILASAVSNAGGAGIIGAGLWSADWVQTEITKAKSLTDKPFGVNIVLRNPETPQIIDIICKEKVSFVTLSAGNPVPHLETFHQAGVKVFPLVTTVKLAKRIESAQADAVIIEGMEGGGHTGAQTTMCLLTNVVPEVSSIPVIAAGGIADGRGVAAALIMGACGVQIGSRFLLTEECQVHPNFKERVLKAVDTDSVLTGFSRGHGVRGLKNAFTEKFKGLEISGASQQELDKLSAGTNRLAAVEGDVENGMVLVGQSLNAINEIKPVKVVIEEMMAEVRETLAKAGNLL